MKQILLDVNIAVDLCVENIGSTISRLAVAIAKTRGARLWLYTGHVQTLKYVAALELRNQALQQGEKLSAQTALVRARHMLNGVTAGYQSLASLPGEGDMFTEDNHEATQLIRALKKITPDTAIILTRDAFILDNNHSQAITPEVFIEQGVQNPAKPSINFIDLKTQQDATRPHLERNIHQVMHYGCVGPEVDALEQKMTSYTGATHCITVASGTEAA